MHVSDMSDAHLRLACGGCNHKVGGGHGILHKLPVLPVHTSFEFSLARLELRIIIHHDAYFLAGEDALAFRAFHRRQVGRLVGIQHWEQRRHHSGRRGRRHN